MHDSLFRGKPISGATAWNLLYAINRVNNDVPNPTPEDIEALKIIIADFDEKFVEALQEDLKNSRDGEKQ